MKNCNEMVNSLLERREEYLKDKRMKRRALFGTAIPALGLCIAILGFGIWNGGTLGSKPSDVDSPLPQSTPSLTQSTNSPDTSHDPVDVIGMVRLNGANYVQCSTVGKEYTPKECLGRASDFEGTYQTFIRNSDDMLYTVNEDSDILMVKLENGSYVILAREKE